MQLPASEKKVVIHQPDFLPYIGFFIKLLQADLFVVLDDVQFLRRGWHHRDRIKTANGTTWLTLGLQKAPRETLINAMKLNREPWREKHLNLIKENYAKSPYFEEIYPLLDKLYAFECETMLDFNLASIRMLLQAFDLHIDMIFSSQFNLKTKSNRLLVDILQRTGASHYISGTGAKDYHDDTPFDEAGIKVIWCEFEHPQYPQLHGSFIPYLSSIDMLFNCGIAQSRKILRKYQ